MCAVALAAPALGAKDDVVLFSRATGPAGAPADARASSPSISAGGERVAFDSIADNLSAEDDNGVTNIFVRDAAANTTVLVSRATGAAGAGAYASSGGATISADGRLVASTSDADNLSTEDNNADDNVFVRDLAASTTTLVSRATGAGGAPADARAHDSAISADGRFVVFRSGADNLSPTTTTASTTSSCATWWPTPPHWSTGAPAQVGPRRTTARSTPASRATGTGRVLLRGEQPLQTRTTTASATCSCAISPACDGHAGSAEVDRLAGALRRR